MLQQSKLFERFAMQTEQYVIHSCGVKAQKKLKRKQMKCPNTTIEKTKREMSYVLALNKQNPCSALKNE